MPVVNAVFFDLFNTLLSVGNVPQSVGRLTADILGFDHEEWNAVCFSDAHDICRPTDHLSVIRSMAHSLNPDIPEHLIQQAMTERQARFDYALCNIDDAVLDTLRQLKHRSISLGLISNASTAEVAAWQHSPLAGLFDTAVFSCECGLQKPDTAIFEYTLQRLGADPGRSLFIGDGGSNEFHGAHRMGFTTVLTKQFSKPARQTGVLHAQGDQIHHHVDHLSEILALCEQPVEN